jgi:hypothetical protein
VRKRDTRSKGLDALGGDSPKWYKCGIFLVFSKELALYNGSAV